MTPGTIQILRENLIKFKKQVSADVYVSTLEALLLEEIKPLDFKFLFIKGIEVKK